MDIDSPSAVGFSLLLGTADAPRWRSLRFALTETLRERISHRHHLTMFESMRRIRSIVEPLATA